jgi:hypothetical protein
VLDLTRRRATACDTRGREHPCDGRLELALLTLEIVLLEALSARAAMWVSRRDAAVDDERAAHTVHGKGDAPGRVRQREQPLHVLHRRDEVHRRDTTHPC